MATCKYCNGVGMSWQQDGLKPNGQKKWILMDGPNRHKCPNFPRQLSAVSMAQKIQDLINKIDDESVEPEIDLSGV